MELKVTNKKCVEVFKNIYDIEPEYIEFCPYRICPLGAHIDHQLGIINGLAINKGIHIAYSIIDNTIEMSSLNFDNKILFNLDNIPQTKVNDWADYLRGAAIILQNKYKLTKGIKGVIEGDLPIGGLSSSAAVTICFLTALCKANNIKLSPSEMILAAKAAENKYVGVNCGKLDQSSEVLSKKDHLLVLDNKDDSYSLIPTSKLMKPYKIAIIFSGLERSLINSKYNLRQDECRAAAYALMGYAGIDYGNFNEANLRQVPKDVFIKYKDRLPDNWRKRALHYYTEFDRALTGAKLWEDGDIEGYGKLVFESGQSSIDNYECGSKELIKLFEILKDTNGVYGARFSGAGFKGCLMALIDPNKEKDIEEYVTKQYLNAFPELKDKYSFYICESCDGVKL